MYIYIQKYMQSSGKVTKTAKSTAKKKPLKSYKSVDDFVKDKQEDNQIDLIRPTTSSSVARKVDEIFEVIIIIYFSLVFAPINCPFNSPITII